MVTSYTPTVLTIAGSDNYGGAGIQIDAKTIHALGAYAFTAITALTAQNSTGVKGLLPTPVEHFRLQLHTILDDIEVDAVKIGMLANAKIIGVVAEAIKKYKLKNIVLDTVLISSSGRVLLESDAIACMIERLFPLVDLITPNLPEINSLLEGNYMGKEDEVEKVAEAFFELGANNVLIKGGHSQEKQAIDYLVEKSLIYQSFSSPRVETTHTHGTGCLLSSAIATYLAKGFSMPQSVEYAKKFLYKKLQDSVHFQLPYHHDQVSRKEPIF
jgi:hydroxymethylpyrimidine/phosphomethylpyrimidine kinase